MGSIPVGVTKLNNIELKGSSFKLLINRRDIKKYLVSKTKIVSETFKRNTKFFPFKSFFVIKMLKKLKIKEKELV